MADPTAEFASLDVRDHIDTELAKRLAREGAVTEFAHVVLAFACGFVAAPFVPFGEVAGWVAFISGAALVRALLRKRAIHLGFDARSVRRSIRVAVCFLGVAWGAGIVVIGEQLPLVPMALITVIVAGLVSGATASLLPDPKAFFILFGLLLAPLAVAFAMHDDPRTVTASVFVIVLYGTTISLFYRRAHGALVDQLRTARFLELAAQAARDARESQRQLADIIEATSDHIGITGVDGKIRYINRAGRVMVGIGAEEPIVGMDLTELVPKRMRIVLKRQVDEILRKGSWTGEIIFQHREGTEVPVSIVAQVHRDDYGNVESLSAIARDITGEIAARNALQTARDAAEQATSAKSAFLANTSHEIRTPLNGILGMVELLLDTELTDSQRRQAELIGESAESLLATINDLLDLSKIEAGQLDLEQISFDFHHLVHSIVRLLMPRADAKHIELVSDVDPRIPQHVIGDAHRMRQVLTNLIGNAVKFTNSGDVVVSARLESEDHGRFQVRIGVKDSGIGIPPENLKDIFEPFRQVDVSTTRLYGGTGLGLSIARRLIQMMDGDLAVSSTVGVGTDFFFTLNFAPGDSAATNTGATEKSLDGVRALVVDDHPTSRRVTVEMLQWGGCVVDDVESAPAALDAMRRAAADKAPYSLLVTDAQLPGDDGFVLAERVRSDSALRDTRIMILTTAGHKGDGQRCRELGVSAYMHKPVSRVELIEAAITALSESVETSQVERASLVTRHSIGATRKQLRVLLVEDNRVNQVVATSLLQKRGHRVEIANNGREAIDKIFSDTPYDVVLMDMQMPVLDGIEATRMIRAKGNTALRIVALTANVSAEERERCWAAGMNDYLSKPFKSHQLFNVVEGWAGSGDHRAVEPG